MANNKKVTLQDVAERAGVSIATVSHAINHTRFVAENLNEKVFKAIAELGYITDNIKDTGLKKRNKCSVICLLLPNLSGTVNLQIATMLGIYFMSHNYRFIVEITSNNISQEKDILTSLAADKTIAGIFIIPTTNNIANYKRLIKINKPIVFLDGKLNSKNIYQIISDYKKAVYLSTQQLLICKHHDIALIVLENDPSRASEQLEGYREAVAEHNVFFRDSLVLTVDSEQPMENQEHKIRTFLEDIKPTACITCGNNLTLSLIKVLQILGLDCPEDISVIGYGDSPWSELYSPPLTVLKQNVSKIIESSNVLMMKLLQGERPETKKIVIPIEIIQGKSIQMISMGPFGEKATAPEELELTQREKEIIRNKKPKVAISLHYGGTAWARLHEQGIRETLGNLGISVISVMDADFDPKLQLAQLDAIRLQKPDALIAIPTDDNLTSLKFTELSKQMKLIFLSNVPAGFNADTYVSCVSVNENENGRNVGTLLGEYYKKREHVTVGFLVHGIPFYGTQIRDSTAEKLVREYYTNVNIFACEKFISISNAYKTCYDLVNSCPEIEGLYISWDQPALEAIRALTDLKRLDIAVFTCDLDHDISMNMLRQKMVKGLSTQRPYEQGVAAAMAVAKSLVSNKKIKYIGVDPYVVKPKQLIKAWKDIMHEKLPSDLEKELKNNFL